MVYRNGIKEYLLTTVLFGGIMGIFIGLIRLNVLLGVIMGVLSGCLFSFLMFLFVKVVEKKFDKMRVEIAEERKIFCDGGATIQGVGGWMFLTENGVEFYPHKINYTQDKLFIPLKEIQTVETKGNQILIRTVNNLQFAIVVAKNNQWKKEIESVLVQR